MSRNWRKSTKKCFYRIKMLILVTGRCWSRPSWCIQRFRRCRCQEILHVLSVGLLRPLFPGNAQSHYFIHLSSLARTPALHIISFRRSAYFSKKITSFINYEPYFLPRVTGNSFFFVIFFSTETTIFFGVFFSLWKNRISKVGRSWVVNDIFNDKVWNSLIHLFVDFVQYSYICC